jgi:(2Fe-2S) ferredoxin
MVHEVERRGGVCAQPSHLRPRATAALCTKARSVARLCGFVHGSAGWFRKVQPSDAQRVVRHHCGARRVGDRGGMWAYSRRPLR